MILPSISRAIGSPSKTGYSKDHILRALSSKYVGLARAEMVKETFKLSQPMATRLPFSNSDGGLGHPGKTAALQEAPADGFNQPINIDGFDV
jgi:hypothetical protein